MHQHAPVKERLFAGRKERPALGTDTLFAGTSALLLATLLVIPVWNACALLTDANYVYWAGRTVAALMITAAIGVLAVYVVTILLFFKWARPSARNSEQTVMAVVNLFVTLLGLTLMLLSLPLSRQAADTYINLTTRCDYSEQTHRTFEYWTVLSNIRAQPDCAARASVEECAGYEAAPPYTSFLKQMESQYRCSGFCWKPPAPAATAAAAAAAPATSAAPATTAAANTTAPATAAAANTTAATTTVTAPNATLVSTGRSSPVLAHVRPHRIRKRHHRLLSLLENPATPFPPSLFSRDVAQASCEAMAARDMRSFAGDVGFQTFYQGVYLVVIAIVAGLLKLVGACLAREEKGSLEL